MQIMLGHKKASRAYKVIFFAAYLSVVALVPLSGFAPVTPSTPSAVGEGPVGRFRFGLLLALITLPIAKATLAQFTDDNLAGADERHAQLHLPFGMMMVFGVLLEAEIYDHPDLAFWGWCISSFFATIACLMTLIFSQAKIAPSTSPGWGNFNVAGFDTMWGPAYGVNGGFLRYFIGTCELLGAFSVLATVWSDKPHAYFLSVGAMIGLATIYGGAIMTRLFVNKGMHVFKCNENTAAIIGPAVFPAIVFSSVSAARFSLVPKTGFNPIEGVTYDVDCQKIVLIFLAVCAFGLFILAPLAHFTVGQRKFSQEILDMDEYFFANGNKWSDGLEAPDGFDLDEELMEGEEYERVEVEEGQDF
jgi:hypothetical protein